MIALAAHQKCTPLTLTPAPRAARHFRPVHSHASWSHLRSLLAELCHASPTRVRVRVHVCRDGSGARSAAVCAGCDGAVVVLALAAVVASGCQPSNAANSRPIAAPFTPSSTQPDMSGRRLLSASIASDLSQHTSIHRTCPCSRQWLVAASTIQAERSCGRPRACVQYAQRGSQPASQSALAAHSPLPVIAFMCGACTALPSHVIHSRVLRTARLRHLWDAAVRCRHCRALNVVRTGLHATAPHRTAPLAAEAAYRKMLALCYTALHCTVLLNDQHGWSSCELESTTRL